LNSLEQPSVKNKAPRVSLQILMLAIFISTILHVLIFNKFEVFPSFHLNHDQQLIEATLITKTAKSVDAPKPEVKEKQIVAKARPKKTEVKPVEPELAEHEFAPALPEVLPEVIPSMDEPRLMDASAEAETTEAVVEGSVDNVVAESLPLSDAPQSVPYANVDIEYDLYINDNKGRAGKAQMHYQANTVHRYFIDWTMHLTGVLALIYPDLKQTSQGLVTEHGLVPEKYTYQFGSNESKASKAYFDWNNKVVTLQNKNGEKQQPLDDATQDVLSFMYQFMYVPPLTNMRMLLTNGKSVSNYDYEFVGEETLSLDFSEVKTYHIKHVRAGTEEKTELWLALDYQFLPVKIEKTEKDGTVIRQIATAMKAVTQSIQEND
jgi:hypothetical protein